MKILFVTNLLPYPPRHGGQVRKYRAAVALSAHHDVWMVGAAPIPEELERFRAAHPDITFVEIPHDRHLSSIPVATAARRLAEKESFDAVHVANLRNWPGEAALTEKLVVLDAENLESAVLRGLAALPGRGVPAPDVRALEALERHALGRASCVLACSEEDAENARRLAPRSRVIVVPNGVDLDYFEYRDPPVPGESPTVGFTGMLAYRPNVDACAQLVHDVLPLVRKAFRETKVRIVGAAPPADVTDLRGPWVEVLGDVPDIRPHLSSADVLAVPLRAGGGTRLKILEALASGVPVVSTPLGAAGLEVEDGRHLRLAREPEALAESIVSLLRDAPATRAMARRGRALVEERYGWQAVGEKLRDAYATLELAA